jgi:hypothetical protein
MPLNLGDKPESEHGMNLNRILRNVTFLAVIFFACLIPWHSHTSFADEWVWPEPTSFHSRGFGFVAEVFPPGSRQNPGKGPLCYFYEMGYPGTSWKIDAHLKWRAPLVNSRMPYQAVVSMEGQLVTLNDHGSVGFENAVAIYDRRGRLLKTYRLDELIPAGETGKFESSESSRWWNKAAKYYFIGDPEHLYIVLPWGKVLQFGLDKGDFHTGTPTDFAELSSVRKKPFANEEAEIWSISLRFSSITDVVEAKTAPG